MHYVNMEAKGMKKSRDLSESPLSPRSKVHRTSRKSSFSSSSKPGELSTRLQHRKSQKLISLINQFEKFDAVTLSMETPSIHPTPRQTSQEESSKQQQRNRKVERYSPNVKTSNSDLRDIGEKNRHDGKIIVNSFIKPTKPLKEQAEISQYLKKELSQSGFSVDTKGIQTIEAPKKNYQGQWRGFNCTSAPSTQSISNSKRRVVSMQEKIKFFDSSISASENKLRPSVIPQIAPRYESVQKNDEDRKVADSFNWRKRASNQMKALNLATMTSDEKTNKRNFIFGSRTPKNFLLHKGSSHTVGSDVSFKTSVESELGKGGTRPGDLTKTMKSRFSNKDPDLTLNSSKDRRQELEDEKRKRNSLQRRRSSKNLSRRPSDKIEAIFRQSLDQAYDDTENRNRIYRSSSSSKIHLSYHRLVNQSDGKVIHRELDEKKKKNFAILRKKFETKSSLDESIAKSRRKSSVRYIIFGTPPSISMDNKESQKLTNGYLPIYSSELSPKWHRSIKTELSTPEIGKKYALSEVPLARTRTIHSQVTQAKIKKKYVDSPNFFFERKIAPSLYTNSQEVSFLLPEKSAQKSTFGLVEDKVKQFESIGSLQKPRVIPKNRIIAKKIDDSFKEFFDSLDSDEKIAPNIESPYVGKSGNSWNEFQCIETHNTRPKRFVTSCREDISRNNPVVKHVEKSWDEDLDSLSLDKVDVWLIKKVNCGLKQPKPRRAVESKKMLLLCRDSSDNTTKVNDASTKYEM